MPQKHVVPIERAEETERADAQHENRGPTFTTMRWW